MKKFALLLLFFVSLRLTAQERYIVDYQYSEIDGANKKTFTLYRDGDKIKIKGLDIYGNSVTMYVLKEEKNIYTLTENSTVKIGSKHKGLDCSYIGMQWGLYILDLDKCQFLQENSTAQGTANITGKDCTIYNVIQSGDIRTDYYIYENKLTLKRTNPTSTIEATGFNDNPVFAPDEFTLPAGVEWME